MKKIRLLLVAAITLSTAFTSFAASSTDNTQFSPDQVKNIEQVVHNYLVTNPQVLLEASKALQAQQEAQQQTSAMNAIKENKAQLFSAKSSPSIGNPQGDVNLVEFFDYQCGHCRTMAPIVNQLSASNKSLHIIFKELPIFGGMSKFAAEAALASMKQDKYHAFHNALFAVTSPLSKKTILDLAKKSGLNIKTLQKDMASPVIKNELAANFQLAQALKIMGTPTFVLSNKAETKFEFIPGATTLSNLKTQIKNLQ